MEEGVAQVRGHCRVGRPPLADIRSLVRLAWHRLINTYQISRLVPGRIFQNFVPPPQE
jgi:hypothetical protein